MKKAFAILLSAVFILSLLPLSVFGISAETDSQGLTYTLSDDGTYYIVSDFDESVTEVVIPSTYNSLPVSEVGDSAFESCYNITNVTIPSSITTIGRGAFDFCSNLSYNKYDNGLYLGNDSNPYHALIGSTYVYYANHITSCVVHDSTEVIADYAFESDTSLTEVTFGASVVTIGAGVFDDCVNLTKVTIPNSIVEIGWFAFSDCENLQYNEYDNGLYLGNSDNPYCALIKPKSNDITSCIIHENTRIIAGNAFKESALIEIEIPNSVITIGDRAFAGCDDLSNIVIGNSVITVGYQAFLGDDAITCINIPNSVVTIRYGAFYNCNNLTSVEFGNSLSSIGKDVFYGCYNLESISVTKENAVFHSSGNCLIKTMDKTLVAGCKTSVIPDDGSVITIGYTSFSHCEDLTSIEIPDFVTVIEDKAFRYSGLKHIKLSDSLITIGNEAFSGCENLENVIIPDSVKSIGNKSFQSCFGLKMIEIPESVASMGNWVFYWCDNLSDIYCNISVQPESWDSAWNGSSATIHWGETAPVVNYEIDDNAQVEIQQNNAFDPGTTVKVKKVNIGDIHETVTNLFSSLLAFDFSATKYGESVQPKETLKVNFAIPENYGDNVSVYFADKDGKLEKTKSTIDKENRTITADIEHFSTYILVDEDSKIDDELLGDINANGELDSLDYILLKRAYFGTFSLTDTAKSAGDINGNGGIDSLDYILLKRAYFGTYEIK